MWSSVETGVAQLVARSTPDRLRVVGSSPTRGTGHFGFPPVLRDWVIKGGYGQKNPSGQNPRGQNPSSKLRGEDKIPVVNWGGGGGQNPRGQNPSSIQEKKKKEKIPETLKIKQVVTV